MNENHPQHAGDPLPRLGIVGIHGHGESHLRRVLELQQLGQCRLVAVADPRPPDTELPGVAQYPGLTELLAGSAVDVVILCTPIHTHMPLAIQALRAGVDVLLEKPPAASIAEFEQLQSVIEETGRICQVGFQSFGSQAIPALRAAMDQGQLGRITAVSAEGHWIRNTNYWKRSRWSGRRTLDGIAVVDGAVTNPFAHAVATALTLAGADRLDQVAFALPDLYRANDIEADDTSTVLIHTSAGLPILVALTLCAAQATDPIVTVHGTGGTATLSYTTDELTINGETTTYERLDLLSNLLAHRHDRSIPLLAPLAATGGFTAVLEAVRNAPDPSPIPADLVDWRQDELGTHPVVLDVDRWVSQAAAQLLTFSALGAPWTPGASALIVDSTVVAIGRSGDDVAETSSPRPYLHPVRTLSGTVVTDAHPSDHDWHLGVGVAIQDVNGVNFWGGRTYLPDAGYTWREDHGRISHFRQVDPNTRELHWLDRDSRALLIETRTIRASSAPDKPGWAMNFNFDLRNSGASPVALGSPGTNGRRHAGYGGFFWRLPPCSSVTVSAAAGSGESAVHGTVSDWLSWSATATDGSEFSLLFRTTATDPWFVRVNDYPGIGSAIAWDQVTTLEPGESLSRAFRIHILDGRVDEVTVRELLADGISR